MVGASRIGGQRGGEHHWTERAGALLATLLHAAAMEELGMRDVLQWIDRHDGARALEILAGHTGEDTPATDLLTGIVATDLREQSGIWSTASGVLAAYRTKGALESTRADPVDFEAFCDGPHTLYLCSAGRRQRQFAPLVVALLGDVRDAAYTRSRQGQSGPPTLLALDEVANIAPIPDLPSMVSEGAGQGLLVLACLQDLSQARVRWGAAADGFLSLFGTTVVLRGIADTSTLRDISALAGERDRAATTVSRSVDRWGRIRPSTSVGSSRQQRLPVDAVAHAPGTRWSSGRTRRCTRSRSRRPTPARRGGSSCRPGATSEGPSWPTAAAESAGHGAFHRGGLAPTEPGPGRGHHAFGATVIGQPVRRQGGQAPPVVGHAEGLRLLRQAPALAVGVERPRRTDPDGVIVRVHGSRPEGA
jgi:hypothetical protein